MITVFLSVFIIVVFLQFSLTVNGFVGSTSSLVKESLKLSVFRRRLSLSSQRTASMLNSQLGIVPVLRKRSTNDNESTIFEAHANPASVSVFGKGRMQQLNGADVRVGIISARHNEAVSNNLFKGVNESLLTNGVLPSNIFSTYVPSPFDVPVTAKLLAASKRVDVIVALGCLTQDDITSHFESTANAMAHGLMQVSLDTLIPCIHGILTTAKVSHAIALSTGASNPGIVWGKDAVEMGLNRMSAMGLDKNYLNSTDNSVPLVTFPSLEPALAKRNSTETKKVGF